LADALGNGRFIPEVAQMLIGDLTPLCESSIASCGLCSNLLILAAGFDSTQANYVRVIELSKFTDIDQGQSNICNYRQLSQELLLMNPTQFP